VRITCWGARGSISVSGPEYTAYGGETTCLEIRDSDGRLVIVDAGTGIRRLGNQLINQGPVKATLLFTHAHWDHISGFPFFKPVHSKTTRLSVICCAFEAAFVTKMLEYLMEAPYFPLPLAQINAQMDYPSVCSGAFSLGRLQVESIPLSHPNSGVGYKFSESGRSFVFLTDNELGFRHPGGLEPEDYRLFCQGADLLVHDAEYSPQEYQRVKQYGHSTYLDALDLALAAEVKKFALFHHNQDRTDDQIEALLADCRQRVRQAGSRLEVMAMAAGLTLTV